MSTSDVGARPTPAPTWADLFSGRNAVYSVALGGSVVLHALNIYVATTVMPSAIGEIGGLDYYSWTTTLFVMASIFGAAISPNVIVGSGARAAYVLAALVFAAGSIACALAPSMPVMLLGRFVQGFGGGLLYALAYSVIRMVFAEHLWGRAIGLISAAWGVSTLIGPALGGIFAELDAWRWAFGSLVPFALIFAVIAVATLPGRSGEVTRITIPFVQLLLLAGATLVLSAGSLGVDVRWSYASVGGAVTLILLLLSIELRSRTTLLPRDAYSRQSRLGILYALGALLVIGMQPEIFVPYILQVLHGLTPLLAGYLAALMAIGWTIGSLVSGGWQGRAVNRALRAGPVFGFVGLALLAGFLPRPLGQDWPAYVPIAVGLILVGFGIGLAWPHLVTRVFQAAPEGQQEQATGSITTVQLFATALGAAAAGTLAKSAGIVSPGGMEGAANTALWLFAGFAIVPLLSLAAAFVATRGNRT